MIIDYETSQLDNIERDARWYNDLEVESASGASADEVGGMYEAATYEMSSQLQQHWDKTVDDKLPSTPLQAITQPLSASPRGQQFE